MKTRNVVGMDLGEMEAVAAGLGEPRYRARQIYAGVYRRLRRSWDAFPDLPKTLRARLAAECSIAWPPLAETAASRDGTRRYLFEVSPGACVESVFIPEEKRDTLCISTQVGCALGCLFCVTGRRPLLRNLTPGEIAGQVLTLAADRGTASRRLNIVIMGMGEPLLNYENVMAAVRLMTDPEGMAVSPRRVTLSTAGVVPGIERLAREPVRPNLAVSLNAATDEVRDWLMPINRTWNIAALLDACRRFPLAERRRITFEYVLVGGVNDSPADARALARLLRGLRHKVNLIPLNPDPSIGLAPPAGERVLEFQQVLSAARVTASVRRARGEDIAAACGMLAGKARGQAGVTPGR